MGAVVTPPLEILFGLLFVLAGPIKAMPTFRGLTTGMPVRERNTLAVKGAAFGALAIALAAFLAEAMAARYAISRQSLGVAVGLLLTIIGLLQLLGKETGPPTPAPIDALSLAFPTLLPPIAFGLILLFALALPNGAMSLASLGIVLMVMNAAAMIVADAVLKRIGMVPLRLLGAIFGIFQVALGIEVLFWGLSQSFIPAN